MAQIHCVMFFVRVLLYLIMDLDLDRYFLQDLKQRFEKLDFDCTYKNHLFYNQTKAKDSFFEAITLFDILDEIKDYLPYMKIDYGTFESSNQCFIKGTFTNEKAFYILALKQKGKL